MGLKIKQTETQKQENSRVFWTFISIFYQFNVPRGFIKCRPLMVIPGSTHICTKRDADPGTTISDSVERIRFPILDLRRTNTHLIQIRVLDIHPSFLFQGLFPLPVNTLLQTYYFVNPLINLFLFDIFLS